MKGRERKRKKDNGKMEWETEKGRKEKVQRESGGGMRTLTRQIQINCSILLETS